MLGCKPERLVAGGYPQRVVEAADGRPLKALRAAGYTCLEILHSGTATIKECKKQGGFTASDLKAAGCEVPDLHRAFTARELRVGGFSAMDCKECSCIELLELKEGGYDVAELRGAGYEARHTPAHTAARTLHASSHVRMHPSYVHGHSAWPSMAELRGERAEGPRRTHVHARAYHTHVHAHAYHQARRGERAEGPRSQITRMYHTRHTDIPCTLYLIHYTLYPVRTSHECITRGIQTYPVPCALYPVPCTCITRVYPTRHTNIGASVRLPCTMYHVPCTLYPVT